jgi:hypothetical protein
MRLHILYIIILTALSAGAQNDNNALNKIEGKVVNEITNEAVAYTNISIEDTFFGTASDEEGSFELKIPGEMISKRINFSAVGFERKSFPVTSLLNRNYIIIKLKPQSYTIKDINIEARSKVLMRILRMASGNIPYNYIGGPFNLIANYENEKITDDTLRTYESAKVVIFDETGYADPSRLNAFQMRKYEITKPEPDYRFSSGIINFDELLALDWVRAATSVLDPSIIRTFKLSMEEESLINGDSAWIISFSQPDPTLSGSDDFYATSFEGQITILKDDYSVKKIEGTAKSTKHNRQGKSLAVGSSDTTHYTGVEYDFLVTYSELKPDLLFMHKKYNYGSKHIEETASLKITKVEMTDIKRIASRDYFVE